MKAGFKGAMLAIAAACILTGGQRAHAADFTDVSSTYRAKTEIDFLTSRNVISGFSDGTFRPGVSVNRAETAAMIGRALGLDGTKRGTGFSDVSSASFASGYIDSAVKAGIISGYSDGTFRPGEKVSRGEMAIMLARAFKLSNTSTMFFSDVSASTASASSINKVAAAGISTGYADSTFRPALSVNRGDFSVFVARGLEKSFRVDLVKTVIREEIVSTDGLNVRSGPSTGYPSKGKVNLGDRVEVYKYTGDWAEINYKGLVGYVHQTYINPPVPELDLKNIIVDAGHGDDDSGAVGNGLLEKNINLDTALRLEKRLKGAGVNAVMTRKTDVFLELHERVTLAKNYNGEMFISIHTNSGGGHGIETYYYGAAAQPGDPYITKSKKLAELIQKRMVSLLGMTSRGTKEGNLHVLRENPMVSNLVELGFIDSATDAKNLGSATWRETASKAIYLGILDYYKMY